MRHALALALIIAPGLAWAAPAHKGAQAKADWRNQVLKATGEGAPDLRRHESPAAARIQAERAAEMDALRIIISKVKGLRVDADQTVGQKMAGNAQLEARVQGVIKNWKITAKRYFSDGGVEVDVEVALGDVVSELLGKKVGSAVAQKKSPYSGLIVDASKLKVQPALAPHIFDPSGKPVYGAENVKSAAIRAHGVAGYLTKLAQARKNALVGSKPLVVRAIKAKGPDLTVSKADAAKIRGAGFLAEGRVIIVAD